MEFVKIDDEDFGLFAAKMYDNPRCMSMAEFEKDLTRFRYLKKLFTRYENTGNIEANLVINHLISIFNVFGSGAVQLCFNKIQSSSWPALKTFLLQINRITSDDFAAVPTDLHIVRKIRDSLYEHSIDQ